MKQVSPKILTVLVGAALVLAGCSKKPTRPDPGQTVMGPQGGGPGYNTSLNPIPIPVAPGTGLEERGGGWDANNQNRELLRANAVFFDYDQSAIKASEREKLKKAKEYLDQNPQHRLLLEGHCDWRGTAEYNLALGDRRANSAKKYLQTLGVAADRLETLSKGSLEAAKGADDATMAKDRRVELVVVGPKPPGGVL